MPKPFKGELSKEFLNRCIPEVLDDGITSRDGKKIQPHHKQAIAVCYSIFNNKKKKKKRSKTMD